MKIKIVTLLAFIVCATVQAQERKWSLEECVNYALEHNISIKQSKLSVDLRSEDVLSARGSFYPSLGASASHNYSFGNVISPQTNSRVSSDFRSNSFNLSTNVTLFNGFRNTNQYKQAKLGVETGKLELQKIKDDISLNVVNGYLNILFSKENLSIARAQLEISKDQVERVKGLVDAGASPKGDLYEVEATVTNDQQKVIEAENNLDLALLNLAQLLQISPRDFDVALINIESPSVALLYQSSSEVYKKAVENRPEIKKATSDVESSVLGIEIAKSGYLPSLSFSTGANTFYNHAQGKKDPQGFDFENQIENNLGYNLGFSLSIPIFSRFQNKVNVARARINKEMSDVALEEQKLRLFETIERAFLDAKSAAKTFEAAKVSLVAQNESFRNAQERFNVGAMTSFDFDQVRNRLVNAQSSLIQAKYDYVFKTKVLKFYYGESILGNNR